MEYLIELVAPVAVCYQPTTSARATSRAIFCDLREDAASEKKFGNFFLHHVNNAPGPPFVWLDSSHNSGWNQHPSYPELTIGPRYFPDGQLIFCQIQQEHTVLDTQELERYRVEDLPAPWLSFFFSPTGEDGDLWRVWTQNKEVTTLAISSWDRDTSRGMGSGWLTPTPDKPYLPTYATDTLALQRWQNELLPFRIRPVELEASA